jgi:hypothetical protein
VSTGSTTGAAVAVGCGVFLPFTVGTAVATITGSTAVGLTVGLCVTATPGCNVY